MVSRTYAQIECSLKNSRKIRGLSSHEVRWAYLCAHLSDFCTYTGLFRYPLHIWEYDAQMDPTELRSAIAELVDARLIDYDPEESFVRIVGWFHKRSGPDNPNRVDSVIADLYGLDDVAPTMMCKSASELASSTVKRAIRWAPNKGQAQAYDSLKGFLSATYQDHGDLFLDLLKIELESASESVCNEIRAMLPALAMASTGASGKGSGRVTPTLREHETRRNEDETETKQEKDKNETAHFRSVASLQVLDQENTSEMLRKGTSPTVSAKRSKLARQAMRKLTI